MDFHYLEHLARRGRDDLHPFGARGTDILLHALQPRPGEHILEVGCGTGGTLVRVAAAGASVVGVDVLSDMLAVARTRMRIARVHERVQLCQIEPDTPLPYSDETFDAAYCESVLGFQDEKASTFMLSEVFRVLRDGGRFVLNEGVWRPGVAAEDAARISRSCVEDFGVAPASPQNWSVEAWCAVMREAGFVVRSADLAAECGAQSCRRGEKSIAVVASRVFSTYRRIRSRLSPRLACQLTEYRARERAHEAEASLYEARLFVLEKPR